MTLTRSGMTKIGLMKGGVNSGTESAGDGVCHLGKLPRDGEYSSEIMSRIIGIAAGRL